MRRNLQIVVMAGLTAYLLSSSLAIPPALAQSGGITASTDENGRTIWVNGDRGAAGSSEAGSAAARTAEGGGGSGGRRLMYWSTTERRYKPVPTSGAVMRAARSAASEVNSYLDGKAGGSTAEGKAS